MLNDIRTGFCLSTEPTIPVFHRLSDAGKGIRKQFAACQNVNTSNIVQEGWVIKGGYELSDVSLQPAPGRRLHASSGSVERVHEIHSPAVVLRAQATAAWRHPTAWPDTTRERISPLSWRARRNTSYAGRRRASSTRRLYHCTSARAASRFQASW